MFKLIFLTILLGNLLCSVSNSQVIPTTDNAQGESPSAAYSTGEADNVNVTTGNVYLNIPVLSYPQRGKSLRLTFRIFYNDKQWFLMNWPYYQAQGQPIPPTPRWSWVAATTQPANPSNLGAYVARDQYLDFGRDDSHSVETVSSGSGAFNMTTDLFSLFVRESNGAKHFYGDVQNKICSQSGTSPCPTYVGYAGQTYPSNDGTGYVSGSSVLQVFDPDGIKFAVDETTGFETVSDPHGNTITQSAGGWTDTLGRNIPGSLSGPGSATGLINADYSWLVSHEAIPGIPSQISGNCPAGSSDSRTWTVPAVGGTSQTYYLCYSHVSFQTSFNLDQTLNTSQYSQVQEASGTATMLTAVVLPTGGAYTLAYDEYLSLNRLSLPTGASITYVWQNVVPVDTGLGSRPLTRALLSRTINPGSNQPTRTWQYHWQTQSTYLGVITDPAGNDVERELSASGPISMKAYRGCSPNDSFFDRSCNSAVSQLLKQEDYVLTSTAGFGASTPIASSAIQNLAQATSVTTTVPSSSGNMVSKIVKTLTPAYASCNRLGLPTGDGQSQVFSETVPNCNRFNQTKSTATYDYGAGQAGLLIKTTATTYQYESAPAYLAANLLALPATMTVTTPTGAVAAKTAYGYDESGSPQGIYGNQTSVTQGVGPDQTTALTRYNTQGMPTQTTDRLGGTTSFVYDSTGAFLSSVQRPATAGVSHTMGYAFDTNTGKLTAQTDENQQVTNYSYTDPQSGAPDPLNRLRRVSYPATVEGLGGGTARGYTQFNYTDTPGQLSLQKVTLMSAASGTSESETTYFDNLGETIRTSLDSDPQGAVLVQTAYDSSGHPLTVSNPYRSSTGSSGSNTYSYADGLGRVTNLLQPDGSTQTWSYDGPTTTYSDEAGNRWSKQVDALGRLTTVLEPAALPTQYSYDANSNLINVDQGAGSGTTLARSFSYDTLSRLVTAANPENGQTTYYYVSQTGPCSGDASLVCAKTDANGSTINYSYDVLNRLIGKHAGDGPYHTNYTLTYDQGSNGVGRLTQEENPGIVGTRYAYDALGRITGTNWYIYMAGTWQPGMVAGYDLLGELTDLVYPDGRSLKQSWTAAGKLSSIADTTVNGAQTSYLSGMQYWPSGAMETANYGNGVTQKVLLNDRLQPCREMASTPLLPANANGGNLFDRQLFHAQVAESTCGDVLTNNGNIWHILEGVGATSSQNFSYDSLNRLTAAYSSNRPLGSAYNIAYNYDPFGNMLPHDNIYTAPNYSIQPATNRLLLNGSDFVYDSVGQLIQAPNPLGGTHNMTYTAEGYLGSIDSNGTGIYFYNASGERAFVGRNASGPNVSWTEYVHFNGQPMAEIDDKGIWTDYIYAAGNKIAKVESTDAPIHLSGDNCSNCGGYASYVTLTKGAGYVVQQGDTLHFSQYNTEGAVGGLLMFFTDGTRVGGETTSDQNGQQINCDGIQDRWQPRHVDLSAFVGKTLQSTFVLNDVCSPAGHFDQYFNDIGIVSLSGGVTQIYGPQLGNTYSVTQSTYHPGVATNLRAVSEGNTFASPADTAEQATHYYLADQVGTTQMELSSGGWPIWQGSFTPFGQEIVGGQTQIALGQVPADGTSMPYKFTGKERDPESGLDYFGARYYGSMMGRFLSPDWAAKAEPVPYAKLDNPQTLNLYAYAGNNPVSRIDADGHDWVTRYLQENSGFTQEHFFVQQQAAQRAQAALAQQQSTSSSATTNPNATAEQHQYDLVVNRTNKLLGTTDAADHIDPDGNLDGGNYAFTVNHNDKSDDAFQRSLNGAFGEVAGDTGAHGGLTPPTHRSGFSTSLHHDNDALHVDNFNGAKFPIGTLLHAIVDVGYGHLRGSNFAFSYSGVQQ